MAKNPPSFQFYPGDFLAGTMHLDHVAIATYLLLLCYQWIQQLLPSDPAKLARICRMSRQQFDEIWPEIEDKFIIKKDGTMYNPRLQTIMDKVHTLSETRREQGRKGGLAKAKQKPSKSLAKGVAKGWQSPSSSVFSLQSSLKPPLPPLLDDKRFADVLADWIKYRGSAYKPRGLKSLLTQAEKRAKVHGLDAVIEAFEKAMGNGYTGWNFDSSFGNNGRPDDEDEPCLEAAELDRRTELARERERRQQEERR